MPSRRRFFRGPGDILMLSFVVFVALMTFGLLCYTKGITDERIAWERLCRGRMECVAQERGYVTESIGGRR